MLPAQTQEILERRRGMAAVSDFVFPSQRDHKRPVRSDLVINALADHRKQLGVNTGFTSHKLRHLCLTWLAENGAGKEIRDRVSNHLPPKTEGTDWIYNKAQLNAPARDWLQR